MATKAAVVNGFLPTSGSRSFTVSGFGTPTAALFFYGSAVSGTNPRIDAAMGVGLWHDGGSQASSTFWSDDASATSASGRRRDASNAVEIISTSSGGLTVGYSASATTDGLTLTLSAGSTGLERFVTIVLLSGTTNESIGSVDLGTGTSAIDVTGPGFAPDLVFFITANSTATATPGASLSWGVARKNSSGTVTQGCVAFSSVNGAADADTTTYVSGDYCVAQAESAAVSYRVTASDFDANGFSLTPNADSGSDVVYYMALQLADADDAYVAVVDSITGTGNQAYTGTGFTPQALLLAQVLNTSTNTALGAGSLAFGAADAARTGVISTGDEDAVATTDAQTKYSTTRLVDILLETFADDTAATLSSFDSNGWTLNYSDGSASARKMLAFAIGDSTAGGGAPTITALSAIGITATSAQPRISYS